MKSVTEYKEYREYVLDYYRERKRCSAFTWREFARLAGFASGSYLKLVCDGKTRLREEGAKKTALAMGLAGFELDYFVLMVRYENAKTDQEKKKCFEEIQALGDANRVKILGSEMYTFYETWKHSVVRELAVAMPGAKPNEIAKVCKHAISASDVSESLRFLVKTGFLTRDIKGNYHQANVSQHAIRCTIYFPLYTVVSLRWALYTSDVILFSSRLCDTLLSLTFSVFIFSNVCYLLFFIMYLL